MPPSILNKTILPLSSLLSVYLHMTNFCFQKCANKRRLVRGAPPLPPTPHMSAPSTSAYPTTAALTNPHPIWRVERTPIPPVSTPPFQPKSSPPMSYEILLFTLTRPATVAPAKVNGPPNHPYTQATLTKLLQITPRNLQALLQVIEIIFVDSTKPASSREFRWFPHAPDTILRSLNNLPFPVDLVA